MSVYNGASYLDEAVISILDQTFSDFEFLIVDDASTDDSWKHLETVSRTDSRIRIFRNTLNCGLSRSINYLVTQSKGRYIARMDADDIAMPNRFKKQLEILESGEASVCGGWAINFGDRWEALQRLPVSDGEIRTTLLFTSAFCNPTVMLNRELAEHYPLTPGLLAQDYDQWVRMASEARMYNVPEVLLRHRVHAAQTSTKDQARQRRNAAPSALTHLQNMNIRATPEEKKIHVAIALADPPVEIQQVIATHRWLLKLAEHFSSDALAQKMLARRWYQYILRSANLGLRSFHIFYRSPLNQYARPALWQYLAIAGLCLFRVKYNSKLYTWLMSASPSGRIRANRNRQ